MAVQDKTQTSSTFTSKVEYLFKRHSNNPPTTSSNCASAPEIEAKGTEVSSEEMMSKGLKFINAHLELYRQYRTYSPEALRTVMAARGIQAAQLYLYGFCELVDLAVWTHLLSSEPERVKDIIRNWKQHECSSISSCDAPF